MEYFAKLSIVIPVYNERENLAYLEEELTKHLFFIANDYEIILIDDGSYDGSAGLIQSLRKINPRIRLISLESNNGQTAAFDAGFKAAKGDVIVTLDADLQNPPEEIPLLLAKLVDCDMVCGRRKNRQDDWIKQISSLVANKIRNELTGESIADIGCSLKVFNKGCLKNLILFDGMHRFLPTLLKMEGYRVQEVPVSHRQRRFGKSKYSIRNRLFKSAFDLLAIIWMQKRKLAYRILSAKSSLLN